MKAVVVIRVEVDVPSDYALVRVADDIRQFGSAYGKAEIIEEEIHP